ncbi:Dna cross-link repair 1a protein [Thalictrum thalictroides]|uniref:Dna cross-link repair 1a protein n=1 Tax=Thalictrum thalictroides TaxID=46969 RepID=A0A7J6VY69_THATH|nr:Dna cross-link repair 1a protein [Thalictrum thalictroides]
MISKQILLSQSQSSQFESIILAMSDDDDDFQNPSQAISLTQNPLLSSLKKSNKSPCSQPLKPSNGNRAKKLKRSVSFGKENFKAPLVNSQSKSKLEESCFSSSIEVTVVESSLGFDDIVCSQFDGVKGCDFAISTEPRALDTSTISSFQVSSSLSCDNDVENGLESDQSRVFSTVELQSPESDMKFGSKADSGCLNEEISFECNEKSGIKSKTGYSSNSIESRLLASRMRNSSRFGGNCINDESFVDFELGTPLNDLIQLCSGKGDEENLNGADFPEGNGSVDGLVECPLCGIDISNLSEESRQVHTNDCLDENELPKGDPPSDDRISRSPQKVADVSPVLEWLRGLSLSKYEGAFVKEEVDWDTLQWLTEEDLISIGVTALGPRKKIIHALSELRKGNTNADHGNAGASKATTNETRRLPGNKLITEFFPGSSKVHRNRGCISSSEEHGLEKRKRGSAHKRDTPRNCVRNGKVKDIPPWCCIPGTPFRVDAFRFLRGDCSHWFLTHFHMDHYQGLTRNFCHGKIYCSAITARLVNMKIGIPWDKMQILPLNQKISIAGVDIICLDANHCPGSIIIFFEPPNGKAVLHTGDFRFSEKMAKFPILQSCSVQTLILDTTYCNPQYDFPKQEAVIQFVIEAIQAEAFNPKTLFLVGSYTIGKERLFIEIARCLRKKLYVGAAKLHTLRCLELSEEDMKWFTSNEKESHIHVVPLWTIASFKRMKHISNQYLGRFNSIVAFSPTGWTFGKGKKKSQGRRSQQGTIIRYEVPYSEHCSFTELKEFVQFISPENIIPSVNNDGPESADAMIAMLES